MTTPLGPVGWIDLLDILCVAVIVYQIMLLIKGAIAIRLLTGLVGLSLVYILSHIFGLRTLDWILGSFFNGILLILIVVFQHDIRRALSAMGRSGFFREQADGVSLLVEELVSAAELLSGRRIGALIVIEREMEVDNYLEVGTEIDAKVSSEIIMSIFLPYSPIHDGAVIIRQGKLTMAGCFLPLSRNPDLSKTLGTRHRAAIGLSEVTDAVVLVVSEETGAISVAHGGRITRGIDQHALRKMLKRLVHLKQKRWFLS